MIGRGALRQRDEREAAVGDAADRVAYIVLSYGVLVLVMARALSGESSWDLLGLVVLSGFVGVAYRARRRVVTRTSAALALAAGLGAVVVAALSVVALHLA
jgi:hypothetical protein